MKDFDTDYIRENAVNLYLKGDDQSHLQTVLSDFDDYTVRGETLVGLTGMFDKLEDIGYTIPEVFEHMPWEVWVAANSQLTHWAYVQGSAYFVGLDFKMYPEYADAPKLKQDILDKIVVYHFASAMGLDDIAHEYGLKHNLIDGSGKWVRHPHAKSGLPM